MSLNQIYTFSLILTSIITGVFGISFFLIKPPVNANLRNYRLFRIIIALCYLSLCISNVCQLLCSSTNLQDQMLDQAIFISISSLQALLFTYAFITLIDYKLQVFKKISNGLLHVVVISIIIITAAVALEHTYFTYVFYGILCYYIALLIYFTRIFLKKYTIHLALVNEFYSDGENLRLQWIYYSFFASLLVGVLVIFTVVFYNNELLAILFMIYLSIFYTYFAIRFINYVLLFQFVEPLLQDEDCDNSCNCKEDCYETILKKHLDRWIQLEHYTQPNISIEQVAKELFTNRSYLSNYINKTENTTFREWIHTLRIVKAQYLLVENQQLTISKISELVGYADCSNFNKQFKKVTGQTASLWKEQHTTEM